MGKRSSFERKPRDYYPTPVEAIMPLIPHLPLSDTGYWEPCAGDGAMIDVLNTHWHSGSCIKASDTEPMRQGISKCDALSTIYVGNEIDMIVTNPPWDRKILHPIIRRFSSMRPTWLLFDADWVHTKQSAPFMPWLRRIVSVGRVKWIPDSKMTGKDNCAWHLFDQRSTGATEFIGRSE